LIESLGDSRGEKLLDAGARRMRALTAYDRVTFLAGKSKATSSRSGVPFASGANATLRAGLPLIVCDSNFAAVPIFPRDEPDAAAHSALLHIPSADQKAELHEPVCRDDARSCHARREKDRRVPLRASGATRAQF